MSLNIEQKKAVVAEVTQVLAGAQVTMLAEYRGLTVAQMTVLRRKAHEGKVYLRVVKNTLARRAVAGSGFECLHERRSVAAQARRASRVRDHPQDAR